jgi:hypothetical protein
LLGVNFFIQWMLVNVHPAVQLLRRRFGVFLQLFRICLSGELLWLLRWRRTWDPGAQVVREPHERLLWMLRWFWQRLRLLRIVVLVLRFASILVLREPDCLLHTNVQRRLDVSGRSSLGISSLSHLRAIPELPEFPDDATAGPTKHSLRATGSRARHEFR